MPIDQIIIRGAKVHNLKNIDLSLPRGQLIVITGLSGSGKSSLAFDTIYAEGQRRYVESLSSYARQFLEQLQKPDVESIEGLSPAISIEQRTAGGSPRSTVATQTEVYDYLRLLFARVGTVYCYGCAQPITRQSADEIIKDILTKLIGGRIEILAPLVRGKKGEYRDTANQVRKAGFARVRVDGVIYELELFPRLDKYKLHNIDLVVDRLIIRPEERKRLADSVETALKFGKGIVVIACAGRDYVFSQEYAWRKGGRGYLMYYRSLLRQLCSSLDIDLETAFNKIPKEKQKIILYGSPGLVGWRRYEGVIPHLERLFKETDSEFLRCEISLY